MNTPQRMREHLSDVLMSLDIANQDHSSRRLLFASDRLLARMAQVPVTSDGRGYRVIGGGSMARRDPTVARATADLDVEHYDFGASDHERVMEWISEVMAVDAGDHLHYEVVPDTEKPIARVPGRAMLVRSTLAGKPLIDFKLELSFSSDHSPRHDDIAQSAIDISAYGIPNAPVPIMGLEEFIANKLHGIMSLRREQPSTRFNDMLDIAIASQMSDLSADRLVEELMYLYNREGGEIPSRVVVPGKPGTPLFERWLHGIGNEEIKGQVPRRPGSPGFEALWEREIPIDDSFAPDVDRQLRATAAIDEAQGLLNPLLQLIARGVQPNDLAGFTWQPQRGEWRDGANRTLEQVPIEHSAPGVSPSAFDLA